MVWIRRTPTPPPPPEPHHCNPPEKPHPHDKTYSVADGELYDLWACDHCGRVWIIKHPGFLGPSWQKANPITQLRYHPRQPCGCKIGREHRKRCDRYEIPKDVAPIDWLTHVIASKLEVRTDTTGHTTWNLPHDGTPADIANAVRDHYNLNRKAKP